MTWHEWWEYAVLLIGIAGPCEQFYILPKPNWIMVWAGLFLFTAELFLISVRIRRPDWRSGT